MTLRSLEVASAAGCYMITVGAGLLEDVGAIARGVSDAGRAALICDTATRQRFEATVSASLEGAGFRVEVLDVPCGETSKTWARAGEVLERLAVRGIGRDDVVVALGGGVVGDLGGFCAAVYMRGIPVIQVPTTLLAQVDSAIGGKTGVDLRAGKNLAGAFQAPLAVIADTACLASLPDEEWRSGLAEVAKSAALAGAEAFGALESDAAALVGRADEGAIERAVWMAAGLKVGVVSSDERESGPRECLNLGHTLGHAIERVAGYGTLTHGRAVAEGLRFAALLAERVIGADPSWSARQAALLDELGLTGTDRQWSADDLIEAMRSDKKARGGVVRFVLSAAPGAWCVERVDEGTISSTLGDWLASA